MAHVIMARSFVRRLRITVRVLVLAVVVAAAGSSTGCRMSAHTAGNLANLAAVGLWTAAVAGEIALLAYHDAHYHHDHCGHYRRWHTGRWVYYYGGHWEYYDGGANAWYYYEE